MTSGFRLTEDSLAKSLGFESGAEMRAMIAAVDTRLPGTRDAFVKWRDDDGTKVGLLKLPMLGGARSSGDDSGA